MKGILKLMLKLSFKSWRPRGISRIRPMMNRLIGAR